MIDAKHYLLEARLLRDKVESFDHYPFSLSVVRNFDALRFHPKVTFIIGDNGAGSQPCPKRSRLLMGLTLKVAPKTLT
jgi:predicted ATPase